jgi:hypothetical protein
MERLARNLGTRCTGPTRPAGHGKLGLYGIAMDGSRSLAAMLVLYPHMGNRRQAKIREVLGRWEHAVD